jgi:hypothetical protein
MTSGSIELVSAVVGLVAFVVGFFGWVIKHYLSELKPNHGTSINDLVKLQILPLLKKLDSSHEALREDITDLKVAQSRLEGRFDQHVEEE